MKNLQLHIAPEDSVFAWVFSFSFLPTFLIQDFHRFKISWIFIWGASLYLRMMYNNNKIFKWMIEQITRSFLKSLLNKHHLASLRFTGGHHQSRHVNEDTLTTSSLKAEQKGFICFSHSSLGNSTRVLFCFFFNSSSWVLYGPVLSSQVSDPKT